MNFSINTAQLKRIMKNRSTAIGVYLGAASVVFLYVTDWKVTNSMIPFYGKKFDDDSHL